MREVLAEGKGYMAQGVKILRYVGCYFNAGAVGDGHGTDVVTLLGGAPTRLHSLHQVTLDSFATLLEHLLTLTMAMNYYTISMARSYSSKYCPAHFTLYSFDTICEKVTEGHHRTDVVILLDGALKQPHSSHGVTIYSFDTFHEQIIEFHHRIDVINLLKGGPKQLHNSHCVTFYCFGTLCAQKTEVRNATQSFCS